MTAIWVPNIGARVLSTGPDMKPNKGRKKSSAFGAQIWAKKGPKSNSFLGPKTGPLFWVPKLGPVMAPKWVPEFGPWGQKLTQKWVPKIGPLGQKLTPKWVPEIGPFLGPKTGPHFLALFNF